MSNSNGIGSARTADLTGVILSRQGFKDSAPKLGLKGRHYGAVFETSDDHRYEIIGLRPGEPKYTIVAKNLHTNKQEMFSHFHVVALLEAERRVSKDA